MKIDSRNLRISRDPMEFDVAMIHKFLTTSYWAEGRTIEEVKKTISNSMSFGLFQSQRQIGFARVLSDKVVFAYLMDFFVVSDMKGMGFGSYFLDEIMNQKDLEDVKTWLLGTRDAHYFYKQFGFQPIEEPTRYLVKRK